jgi:hypothetical protein
MLQSYVSINVENTKYKAIALKDMPLSEREVVCGLFNDDFSISDYSIE